MAIRLQPCDRNTPYAVLDTVRFNVMFDRIVVLCVCVTVLEAIALLKNLDGQLLMCVVSSLTGVVGYGLGRSRMGKP